MRLEHLSFPVLLCCFLCLLTHSLIIFSDYRRVRTHRKLSGHQLDEKEVERIAEDFIREQATLEFVDDMVRNRFFYEPNVCISMVSFLIFDYGHSQVVSSH